MFFLTTKIYIYIFKVYEKCTKMWKTCAKKVEKNKKK